MVFGSIKTTINLPVLVGGKDDYIPLRGLPYAEPQLKGGVDSLPVE
tara:strand:+ start:1358 stop:1495 length:138 start_codon:yes stop_codon:yes gene_type:complete